MSHVCHVPVGSTCYEPAHFRSGISLEVSPRWINFPLGILAGTGCKGYCLNADTPNLVHNVSAVGQRFTTVSAFLNDRV